MKRQQAVQDPVNSVPLADTGIYTMWVLLWKKALPKVPLSSKCVKTVQVPPPKTKAQATGLSYFHKINGHYLSPWALGNDKL